jgi:2,3-bisphosphoglycerate-dependent phosphoglycerate mutase
MSSSGPHKIVFIRHGESSLSSENRFCGWIDAELSARGVAEATQAGKYLKENGYVFDIAYTSVLRRAIKTLNSVLDVLDLHWIPAERKWRLNERMYGALQGLNKTETAEKFGEDQVKIWRRSYDIPPPIIENGINSPMYPGDDPKYKNVDKTVLPMTESLKTTLERVLPCWIDEVGPSIRSGKRVLVVAHGTSIRALIKYLDNVPEKEIIKVNIPTGIPLVYELDENLRPIKHYYLADDETVRKALERVHPPPPRPHAKLNELDARREALRTSPTPAAIQPEDRA